MTVNDLKTALKSALGNLPDADNIAEKLVGMAVRRTGRHPRVNFNRAWDTDTFTTGQSSYELGAELFPNQRKIVTLEDLRRTDVVSWPIRLIDLSYFNDFRRGGTSSGPPKVATIIGYENPKIEVYPIPDSNYSIGAYVKYVVIRLEDIPDHYHDVVLANGIELAQAARSGDGTLAQILRTESMNEMTADSQLQWTGSQMRIERNLGYVRKSPRATSDNLRPGW